MLPGMLGSMAWTPHFVSAATPFLDETAKNRFQDAVICPLGAESPYPHPCLSLGLG